VLKIAAEGQVAKRTISVKGVGGAGRVAAALPVARLSVRSRPSKEPHRRSGECPLWRRSGKPFSATLFRRSRRARQISSVCRIGCRESQAASATLACLDGRRLLALRFLPDRVEGIGDSGSFFFPSWTLVSASVAPSSQPRRKELVSGNNSTR
jgi:hypothetical protein